MSAETPLELTHLIARLHADFDARIAAATSGTAAHRETNFLSRALAAFAIHNLDDASLDQAAATVVDAGGDYGLDAIHFSPTGATLWLVQCQRPPAKPEA